MKKYFPLAAACIAAIIAENVAMRAVHDELVERQSVGYLGAGQYRFVVMCTLVGAALTYWLARRLQLGPKMTREDWSLHRDKAAAPIPFDLAQLDAPLRRYGYAPVLDGADPLLRVLRQTGRRHGGVRIDVRKLMTDGVGTVEASDTGNELYVEMAKFAMLELGRLVPGTTYRGSFSVGSPEKTEKLEPLLPDKPHYL